MTDKLRSIILKQFLKEVPEDVCKHVRFIANGIDKNPKATRHLIYCLNEIVRRNDKERSRHEYKKGLGYFKKQVELTTKILKK